MAEFVIYAAEYMNDIEPGIAGTIAARAKRARSARRLGIVTTAGFLEEIVALFEALPQNKAMQSIWDDFPTSRARAAKIGRPRSLRSVRKEAHAKDD